MILNIESLFFSKRYDPALLSLKNRFYRSFYLIKICDTLLFLDNCFY